MAKVFINPGHDRQYDSGACHRNGRREADVAYEIGVLAKKYLEAAYCEVKMIQSDNLCMDSVHDGLPCVTYVANDWPADIFVSIHCNAFNGNARGTETLCYNTNSNGGKLAYGIHGQLLNSIPGLVDRGVKGRKDLIVLKHTDMPAVLVETAFIDNDADLQLLEQYKDDFARAIARGVTDYLKTLD